MMRLALVAMAAIAIFTARAHADVTVKSQDGTMEITLPNGWHELKPQGAQTQIVANDRHGARVAVRAYSKEDFKDMKSVAGFSAKQLKLVETPDQKIDDIDVNGKPGVRLEVSGTEPNGMKRGFIITVFEANGRYIDVIASAHASAFTKNAELLGGLAKQLVLAANAAGTNPAPASGATPAATPGPAPGTPATSTTPTPTPNPPRRR